MKATTNTIELTFERTIPASPAQAFEGWLSPKVSGTPWNIAEKLSLDPKIDGFFYVHVIRGLALWAIYGSGETGSNSAHMGVSEHLGPGIDSHFDLQETTRKHNHDPRAARLELLSEYFP
jgi:hypothetical protein